MTNQVTLWVCYFCLPDIPCISNRWRIWVAWLNKHLEKNLCREESEMEVEEVLYQGFCFIFRTNWIMLSSANVFHHAQVSHGTFHGFLAENVFILFCFGFFFHSFSVLCLIFQVFPQKNADKNLSSFFFFPCKFRSYFFPFKITFCWYLQMIPVIVLCYSLSLSDPSSPSHPALLQPLCSLRHS